MNGGGPFMLPMLAYMGPLRWGCSPFWGKLMPMLGSMARWDDPGRPADCCCGICGLGNTLPLKEPGGGMP